MHYEQMQLELEDLCCGKMSQEHYQVPQKECQRVQISKLSLRNVLESHKRMPLLCLSLKQGGLMQEFYWEEISPSHGELQTYNIMDAPKGGKELHFCAISMDWKPPKSCLNNILQDSVDEKYYLSAKACKGVLNRANKHNDKLPEQLINALKHQIEINER